MQYWFVLNKYNIFHLTDTLVICLFFIPFPQDYAYNDYGNITETFLRHQFFCHLTIFRTAGYLEKSYESTSTELRTVQSRANFGDQLTTIAQHVSPTLV